MNKIIKDKIKKSPAYLLLLPVFYFTHQVNEHYAQGLGSTAARLVIIYFSAGILLTILLFIYLKHWQKAALSASVILCFDLFFGYIIDQFRYHFGESCILTRYSFIVPISVFLYTVSLYLTKRIKSDFNRIGLFANILFLSLTIYETIILVSAQQSEEDKLAVSPEFIQCDSCEKPDVYVIIADEYAGKEALETVFKFRNDSFERALSNRGFFNIPDTRSNYNATAFSMASLFNMNYVPTGSSNRITQGNLLYCRNMLNKNHTASFFQKLGYTINNLSFFEFQKQPKAVTNYYFHSRARILHFGTFINRFQIEAGFNFFSDRKAENIRLNDFTNDEIIDSLAIKIATEKNPKPEFNYIHFTRPHHPYYVDRSGKPMDERYNSLPTFEKTKKQYIEHLLYTNTRLLQLVDSILYYSSNPPIIILSSDHGFRQFNEPMNKDLYFMNFCAVYLPHKINSQFYKGITPVNIFRVILNTEFRQQLPLLKDSSSFLIEKPD